MLQLDIPGCPISMEDLHFYERKEEGVDMVRLRGVTGSIGEREEKLLSGWEKI